MGKTIGKIIAKAMKAREAIAKRLAGIIAGMAARLLSKSYKSDESVAAMAGRLAEARDIASGRGYL